MMAANDYAIIEWVTQKKDPPGFKFLESDSSRDKTVISLKSIVKGQFVLEHPGTLLSYNNGIVRQNDYERRRLKSQLLFFEHKGDKICIDSTLSRQFGCHIQKNNNNANVSREVIVINGQMHLIYRASKDIFPGDAIICNKEHAAEATDQIILKVEDNSREFAPLWKTFSVIQKPEDFTEVAAWATDRKPTFKSRYCEVCRCTYTSLKQHLALSSHQQIQVQSTFMEEDTTLNIDKLVCKITAENTDDFPNELFTNITAVNVDECDSDLIPNVSNLDIVMDSLNCDTISEHLDDIMIDPDWIPDKNDSNMNMSEDLDVSLKSDNNKMDENFQEVKISQEIEEDGVHTDAANTRAISMPEKTEHKKPKRSCLFCKKEQSQLRRHLRIKHKNEPEIRAIEKLPLKARAEAYDTLRKKAIFAINQQKIKSSEPLIRERDQGDGELAMCTYCRGFYNCKYFYKHLKQCHAREETTLPVSKQDMKYIKAKTKAYLTDKTVSPFETEVLTTFKMDDTGNICRTDKLIKTYGEKEWYSSGQKNKQSVMSNMRSLANLLIEFRKQEENEDLSGEDMLDRTRFQSLETSIRNLTEDSNGEEKAAQKLKLGYAIKSAAKSMAGLYGMGEDTELVLKNVKSIEMFVFVLEHNWGKIFVSAQKKLAQRRAEVLRKPQELPIEEDMMKLKTFVEAEIAESLNDPYNTWGQYEYNRLRSMLLTRLTLYNARRGGEPARLTLNEWESAKKKEWVDPSVVSQIDDPVEKHLAGQYLLAHQPGKGGRTLVPLLIPNNIVAAIHKIVEIREEAGVAKENPFLFANTQGSMEHCRRWDAVHEVTKAASLNNPSKVTATSVRHRASTYYALLDVSRAERLTFLKHMGHSEEVSNNIYTTPSSYMELCKVGRFFEALDEGHVNPASSKTITSLPHTKNNSRLLEVSSVAISNHEQTLSKVSRKCTQAKKVMWKPDDEVKVMDYFHTNLVTDVVPNKKQVDAFFALNPRIAIGPLKIMSP